MSTRWPRLPDESDDAYFVRVIKAAEIEFPELTRVQLYFGACDETGLECIHPWPLRECDLQGTLAVDYLKGEPPCRLVDSEYMKRFNARTWCPVCRMAMPHDPVDIRKRREQELAAALVEAAEQLDNI